jgi:acyl carrier protein
MPVTRHDIERLLAARPDVAEASVIDFEAPGPFLVLIRPRDFCNGPEIRDECAAAVGAAGPRVTVSLVTEITRDAGSLSDPDDVLRGAPYVYRYEPPATSVEERLLGLWNEVLGRERTGVLDDFLDLGGDSVRAVQLVNRINEDMGTAIDIISFFDAPSVRDTAKLVESTPGTVGAQSDLRQGGQS